MKRRIRIMSFLVVSILGLLSHTAIADVVKMSTSGLCHPPQSSWYERTQNYRAFKSLDDCLDAGGKLPRGVNTLTSSQQTLTMAKNYDRSAFGHGWEDSDGDCQDSRAEALIATSTTSVRFATKRRCRVITGRWISPFTGEVIQNASDIDIDHVVPLAWSWDRGAKEWPYEKREKFANDLRNLWPVEASFSKDQHRIGKALLL
ncbi:HNH endonuclease family protein [Marinobacter sp. 1-4A]|uniref:HNH endonuclease family protein n=1 Tax=Marinobacter sp. 1-4A TaxID=2582919 RepID=UPI001D113836|nr:HNH endonuclease family protein [Marinobacter sp. 1-4A]